MRHLRRVALLLTAFALHAPAAGASTGPLPVASLEIRASGLSGMGGAHRYVFTTLSPGRWAGELTESEREFKAYNQKLFEWSFDQGVITSLEGRREGRLRREVVSWVVVFASAEGAQREMSGEAATVSHNRGAAGYSVPAIPGAAAYGSLHDRGRKGGYENVVFATGRCQATVGDSLHRRSPAQLDAEPATAAAVALYRRLAPLCA